MEMEYRNFSYCDSRYDNVSKEKKKEVTPSSSKAKTKKSRKKTPSVSEEYLQHESPPPLLDAHLLYEGKLLQLLHNLRSHAAILMQRYAPHELVWLDDTELALNTGSIVAGEESKAQRLTKILEDSTKHTTVSLQGIPESNATFLRCRKCKSTKIEFNQKQTRSGDEGMTSFCICKDCGTTWKM